MIRSFCVYLCIKLMWILKGALISGNLLFLKGFAKKQIKERWSEERALSDDVERKENTNGRLFIRNFLKHGPNLKLAFDIILDESFTVSIRNYRNLCNLNFSYIILPYYFVYLIIKSNLLGSWLWNTKISSSRNGQ